MTSILMIGLGNMGLGMCANLVKAECDVLAYDLRTEPVHAATKVGARAVENLQSVCADVDVIVTMLPAGAHVLDVYFGDFGVANKARAGALFIDCSTISVKEAREACGKANALGFRMVDAPVSGGVAAANLGNLTFMVGGDHEAFALAKPVLESMGKKIVYAGAAGNGQVAKIANNMLLGVSMIATCEAFDLAARLGLDAQTFFDISSNASGQNWSMTSYCPAPGPVPSAPSNHGYEAGFAVDMMLKDLRLAVEAADSVGANAKFGYLAQKTYDQLSNNGHGADDFSVIMKMLSAYEG